MKCGICNEAIDTNAKLGTDIENVEFIVTDENDTPTGIAIRPCHIACLDEAELEAHIEELDQKGRNFWA